MADPVACTTGLVRDFRVVRRRAGLVGSLRDLVRPERATLRALDGLDLTVHAGEIVALLGPNGAGKSTAVKCLTGLLKPTSGQVRVAGMDPWAERTRAVHAMGVVFGQRSQLWWDLAVREGFDLLAAVFRVPDADYRTRMARLTEVLELEPLWSKPVRELSLGQRVRCDLAASLVHGPRLLVLDEATLGLDAGVKRRIRRFVRELADEGMAVLMTSHDLGDVEQLAHRLVLLDGGRVAFEGDVAALRARAGAHHHLTLATEGPVDPDAVERLARDHGARVVLLGDDRLELALSEEATLVPVLRALLDTVAVTDVSVHAPGLEELLADRYDHGERRGEAG